MIRLIGALIAGCALSTILVFGISRGIHIAEHGRQSSTFDIALGRSVFEARCARCHSVRGPAATIGPNLSQIGAIALQRKPEMTASGYLLESILNPRAFKAPGSSGEMPVNLIDSYDDDTVRSLVAYLCSLGGTINEAEIQSLSIERPLIKRDSTLHSKAAVLRGEQLYRGKGGCALCHPFYGGAEYELMAPQLFFRGHRDREELRRSIIAPHQAIAPKYRQTAIVLLSGQSLTGRLISRDEVSISLLVTENGRVVRRDIPVEEIDVDEDGVLQVIESPVSAMPTGIEQLLTPEEMEDLLTFLLSAN